MVGKAGLDACLETPAQSDLSADYLDRSHIRLGIEMLESERCDRLEEGRSGRVLRDESPPAPVVDVTFASIRLVANVFKFVVSAG